MRVKHRGGFFELEIPKGSGPFHRDAVELSTGRAGLLAVLREVQPRRLHLPFYLCDVVWQQTVAAGVTPVPYGLGPRLEPAELPRVGRDDMLLVVNYFGLSSTLVRAMAVRYVDRCIVDNTHAFFDEPAPQSWSIYSARKFFGVPDGAYLRGPRSLEVNREPAAVLDIGHLVNRLEGQQDLAYRQCKQFEAALDGRIRQMTELSRRLLNSYDYESAANARRRNFVALHAQLAPLNRFSFDFDGEAVPFTYPFLPARAINRARLAKQRLYVPTLWEDVCQRPEREFAFEKDFARRLLPLPVDQRYGVRDMNTILRILDAQM